MVAVSNVHAQDKPEPDKPADAKSTDYYLKDVNSNNVEETLIDFTQFETLVGKDYVSKKVYKPDQQRNKPYKDRDIKNKDQIDPKTLAPVFNITAEDLQYKNWTVELNSSSNSVHNRRWSYAKKVTLIKPYQGERVSKEDKGGLRKGIGHGAYVLGARIHFPKNHYNAYAKISPPFELRAYDEDGRVVPRQKEGKFIGIIDNVGEIKKITLDVSGRNFRNGVAVRLKDNTDTVKEYFMGYVYFANWRRLTWNNPNYITSVDHRTLFRVPLYPMEIPHVKFDSLIVYRPGQFGQFEGGDFVIYFRKIDMWFDYAVAPTWFDDLDIDDELQWKILTKRAAEQKRKEELKFREQIELRRQEAQKMGSNVEKKDIAEKDDKKSDAGDKGTETTKDDKKTE